jgi:hypothetical protein
MARRGPIPQPQQALLRPNHAERRATNRHDENRSRQLTLAQSWCALPLSGAHTALAMTAGDSVTSRT